MLTNTTARAFWSKFAAAPYPWLMTNKDKIARAALMIYRKAGREEARTFLRLIRLSLVVSGIGALSDADWNDLTQKKA